MPAFDHPHKFNKLRFINEYYDLSVFYSNEQMERDFGRKNSNLRRNEPLAGLKSQSAWQKEKAEFPMFETIYLMRGFGGFGLPPGMGMNVFPLTDEEENVENGLIFKGEKSGLTAYLNTTDIENKVCMGQLFMNSGALMTIPEWHDIAAQTSADMKDMGQIYVPDHRLQRAAEVIRYF